MREVGRTDTASYRLLRLSDELDEVIRLLRGLVFIREEFESGRAPPKPGDPEKLEVAITDSLMRFQKASADFVNTVREDSA